MRAWISHAVLPRGSSGQAMVVALWVVMLLSMLIASLAYEMHVESAITSYSRKRLKAQAAAEGGIEYARFLLARSFEGNAEEQEDESLESERIMAKNLARGIGVTACKIEFPDATATVDILPEAGRRNVNALSDEDWEEILDQSGVPEELWPDLIDGFMDFTDEGDEHRLNGAEKDDPFYESQGYPPKNAPLDTVDELLLVKGFTPEIVYGGRTLGEGKEPVVTSGIAPLLTTWGDGKVNINTASREVLLTLTDAGGNLIDDWVVDDILSARLGDDGAANTEDDGFESVADAISKTGLDGSLAEKLSVSDRQYVRVVSTGEAGNVKAGVWAVFDVGNKEVIPLYWREAISK